jgi:hypothetical protein
MMVECAGDILESGLHVEDADKGETDVDASLVFRAGKWSVDEA